MSSNVEEKSRKKIPLMTLLHVAVFFSIFPLRLMSFLHVECIFLAFHERLKIYTHHVESQIVYFESIKREINKRLIFECRCDGRLKVKTEGCTRLAYTMWREEP